MPEAHYDCNITFYGFDDNDDGKGNYGTAVIAFPGLHKIATEDKGSYSRPSTFATEPEFIKPGTKIYVPRLKKYYVMEDECRTCTKDWKQGVKHIDLFIGSNTKKGGAALEQREEDLTIDEPELIIIDPPDNLPVNEEPLYV